MRIASAATALPKHQYDQQTILQALKLEWADKLEQPEFLDRLHARTGVSTRSLALPLEAYPALKSWGEANQIWIDTSCELGQAAVCQALTRAELSVQDPAAFFFVSISGVASPSIDAKLVNLMGLNRNIKRVPIFGLGCVAGAAGIARAADYVRAFPDQAALLLSVELCSLTIQRDDLSIANLISSGLFGDGAAAVIVCGDKHPCASGPEILGTRSVFYPGTEDVMGWDIGERGFKIVLSKEVPNMVYRHLAGDIDAFLAEHDLSRGDIGAWVMHTGGPAILTATENALHLPDGALDASWDCFETRGQPFFVICIIRVGRIHGAPQTCAWNLRITGRNGSWILFGDDITEMVNTFDVAIAGGGPAGLTAAIAARRKGLTVAVFEGLSPTTAIDKCCGEGLMPEALEALSELGIELPDSICMPVTGLRFNESGYTAEARFPNQLGVGVRRTALHAVLQEHAQAAGVSMFWNRPARKVIEGGMLAGDEEVKCRWLVGADGSQSVMRRAAGLESPVNCPRRFGLRRHFRMEPWTDLVEAYWAHGVQAFVTPVGSNEIDVAVLSSDSRLRYEDAVQLHPELWARIKNATPISNVRGAVTASRRLDRVATQNIALTGDASGSVDSVTGLGLMMSFQQAAAVAEAISKEDLSLYESAHRRLAKRPRIMESIMLAMDQRDTLRRRAIRTLAAEPRHFSELLAFHTGASSLFSFALRTPLALGWRFLKVS